MARAIVKVLCWVAFVPAPLVADDDPVAKKLDAAKARYTAEMEKVRTAAEEHLNRREEAARKDGNKKLVDQIKAERQALQKREELPATTPAAVKEKRTTAQAALRRAYEAAVADYTRARQDAEAAQVNKELDEFAAKTKTDAFKFDGVWLSKHASGWQGKRTVKGDKAFDADGTELKWVFQKGDVLVTWPGGGSERLTIDPKNPDQLTGKTGKGVGTTWVRQK